MELQFNILCLIVVALLGVSAVVGYRRGLVDGVVRIFSYFVGIVVLYVLAKGVGNFIQGNMLLVLLALILLLVIRLVNRIIRLLLDSCRLVSKLPVVSWLDHLAGIAFGLLQMLCLIWIAFIVIGMYNVTALLAMIESSTLLSMIYHNNYIILLLQLILT